MTTPAVTDKTCADCGELKPLTAFKKHGTSSDGRQHKCIACGNNAKSAKKCAACGLSKALAAYPVNLLRPDGHGSWCTDCHNTEARRTARRIAEARMQRLYAAGLVSTEPAYSA